MAVREIRHSRSQLQKVINTFSLQRDREDYINEQKTTQRLQSLPTGSNVMENTTGGILTIIEDKMNKNILTELLRMHLIESPDSLRS